MLDIPIVDKFIKKLWDIENTIPDSELHLLKLYRNAQLAKELLQDSIQQILLPLPQLNQLSFLRNCLEQLNRDSSNFHKCEWWIEECIRGNPNSYWMGEIGEVARFLGVTREALSETAYNIAINIADKQDPHRERVEQWRQSFNLVKRLSNFAYKDLEEILNEYRENGDKFPFSDEELDDNIFTGHCTSIITKKISNYTIYSVASHLAFIEDPKTGFTVSPSFRWQSVIEPDLTDLISGLYEDEKAGYAPAIEWRAMLSEARDKMYQVMYWGVDNQVEPSAQVPSTLTIQWQGSKTELAELGYALLEAGLISGPREATLKALADFFGQDLGNPAKHLQTLQKRKWDPGDKEPVTPLLDRLRTALKNLLKIKAIAPDKKQ